MTAPNLFELEGAGVAVTYTVAGLDGRPQLTYRSEHLDLAFSGDEIAVERSPIGTLVTVELVAVPDHKTTTFTLLVPAVRPGDDDPDGSEVATQGITTERRTSIAPSQLRGQLERFTPAPLAGRARFVET